MQHDFNAQLEKDQKDIGTKFANNSKYFNLAEGNNNVFRVLTPGVAFATYYLGKGQSQPVAYGVENGDPRIESETMKKSIRYILYVIDRTDGLVKQAELPYTIIKSIGDLQHNPDYSFAELPMPYDIRVTYNKEESPANKYKVSPSKTSPVTPIELGELEKMMAQETPEEAIEKKKERQIKADKESGAWTEPSRDSKPVKEEVQESPVDLETTEDVPDFNPDDIPF